MLKHTAAMIVAGIIVLGATTVAATADSCSSGDHSTGTMLGATVSGAVATRSMNGAIDGTPLGGGIVENAVVVDRAVPVAARVQQNKLRACVGVSSIPL